MAYSVQADVQNAVGGLANLTALADFDGNVAVAVASAIAEADGLINSFISKRFAVPIASPPPMIVHLSARIAARILRRNRMSTLPDDIETDKLDRAWLEQLAAGAVLPGAEPLPLKAEIVTDQVGPRDSTKINSRERSKGFW